jgi:hypothetical protein
MEVKASNAMKRKLATTSMMQIIMVLAFPKLLAAVLLTNNLDSWLRISKTIKSSTTIIFKVS